LPLRLLNFSGQRRDNYNLLQWKTAGETGTKTFEVQSSANSSSFLYLGSVAASGGGSYSFADSHPLANPAFYRLKIIDADGRFTYSNIIRISGTGNNKIILYPNPVVKNTTLDVGSNNALIGTQAQLTDAGGRLLRLFTISNNQEQLDMAGFATGLYFLKLNDGKVIKIFKQ